MVKAISEGHRKSVLLRQKKPKVRCKNDGLKMSKTNDTTTRKRPHGANKDLRYITENNQEL